MEEEQKKRREWLLKHWPFVIEDDLDLWNAKYNCIHCGKDGEFKNYKLKNNYIMCEHDCDGSALDMWIIDPVGDQVRELWESLGMPDDWSDERWQEERNKIKGLEKQAKA